MNFIFERSMAGFAVFHTEWVVDVEAEGDEMAPRASRLRVLRVRPWPLPIPGRSDLYQALDQAAWKSPPNKKVKLAGKTLRAILARRVGSNTHLIAPVAACSLPPMR